jgi:hypothetical protein
LPSKTSLASTTSSTSPPYLAIAALVLAIGHELFHVMDDDLSYQIRCHSFYASSQQELDGSHGISRQAYGIRQELHERSGGA